MDFGLVHDIRLFLGHADILGTLALQAQVGKSLCGSRINEASSNASRSSMNIPKFGCSCKGHDGDDAIESPGPTLYTTCCAASRKHNLKSIFLPPHSPDTRTPQRRQSAQTPRREAHTHGIFTHLATHDVDASCTRHVKAVRQCYHITHPIGHRRCRRISSLLSHRTNTTFIICD